MLEARGLTKSFGALTVARQVSLQVARGERRVLLGPNGAGKTTLFNLLVGELAADSGQVLVDGRDVTALSVDARARLGLARSYQRNNLFAGLTVRENLGLAAACAQGKASALLADSLRDRGVAGTVEEVAVRVGLAELLGAPVETIPYGARRRLEVGLALASRPRILLMDEPTSGIGPGGIKAFHAFLHGLPSELTILIVEHDMDLAFDIADRVTVLNHGEVVFDGPPRAARDSALVREIYLGTWGADGGADA
jgi:ABC-type branched-subunit amino acid transport system ATPase component